MFAGCQIPWDFSMRAARDVFPFQPITVECALCSELRRYLPSEVPDHRVTQQRTVGRVEQF
jgi:hypothetical protein